MKTDKLLQLIQQKKFMRSGGALPLPKAEGGNFPKSPTVNTNESITRSYFDPKNGEIYLNPYDLKDSSNIEHEKYHYNQWLQNRLRTPDWYDEEKLPVKLTDNVPLQQPSMLTTEDWDAQLPYYNRRLADEYIISNQLIKDNPSFNFVPYDLIYNGVIVSDTNPANPTHKKRILGTDSLMYHKPWTAEGEAQSYQNSYRNGMALSPEEYDWMKTQGFKEGGSFLPKAKTGIAGPCPPPLVKNAKGECVLQVTNPNDPNLKAYRDSSDLYTRGLQPFIDFGNGSSNFTKATYKPNKTWGNTKVKQSDIFNEIKEIKSELTWQKDAITIKNLKDRLNLLNKSLQTGIYPTNMIYPETNTGALIYAKPKRKVELIEPPLEPIPLRKIDLTESMKLFNEDSDDLDAQLKTNFTPVNTELTPPITETTNTPPATYNYPEESFETDSKRRKPKYYKHKQKEGPGWLHRLQCRGDDCPEFAEGGSLPKALIGNQGGCRIGFVRDPNTGKCVVDTGQYRNTNATNVRSTVSVAPKNLIAESAAKNIATHNKNTNTVDFIDKRVYDPVVKGKTLGPKRKHNIEGVSRDELNKLVEQAKVVGVDPATLITIAGWETNIGQSDDNLVHDLYQTTPTIEGLDDFSARANMAAQALKRQLAIGQRLYRNEPFYKQMQAFEGYKPLYPDTEKRYYKHKNSAFYGIPVTKEKPLRTNVVFPYGKTIENFRDSVVIPTLEQYGIKYKEKGGSLPKAQKGLPSKWMRPYNGAFLANFKGTTLDEEADAERKRKQHEEFVKNQQEEDQKKYGVEAWKTGKTIEQLKDEENEKWYNYYKFQNRLWELEEDPSKWNINDWKNYRIPEGDASAGGLSNPLDWPGLALTGLGAWEAGAPVLGAINSGLSVPLSTVATFGNSAALPWLTGNTLLGAYSASLVPGNLRRGEYGWAALNSLPFTAPLLGAGFRGAKNLYNTVAGESGLFSKFKGTPPIQATEYTVPEPVEFYPKGFNLEKSFAKIRKPKPSVDAEPLTDKLVLEKNPSRVENVDEYIGTKRELKRVVDPSTNESISLKSWIDENGNVRYYFSSQMPSSSYNAGKSYYALDKYIPKNSTIAEPPGGSLSFDSFINTVKRTKNSKFKSSLLEGSEGIRLNNQSVKNKLPFSGDIGDGYYSSAEEAQKVADEINGFIKDYNLPKATVTQHPYDGSYQIMLPHISLEKLYKKGGELTSQKAAEILHDGTANGKPLTDKQKRYFGYIANKNKRNG